MARFSNFSNTLRKACAPSSINSSKISRGKLSFGSGFIKILLSKLACFLLCVPSHTFQRKAIHWASNLHFPRADTQSKSSSPNT